jgi:hypothetical protein
MLYLHVNIYIAVQITENKMNSRNITTGKSINRSASKIKRDMLIKLNFPRCKEAWQCELFAI